MRKKRKLFDELMEGLDALADQRAGKRTLRTHAVKPKPVPEISAGELTKVRENMKLSRSLFARYLRTNVRTLENWEQGQAKCASGTAHSPCAALSRYSTASRGDLETSHYAPRRAIWVRHSKRLGGSCCVDAALYTTRAGTAPLAGTASGSPRIEWCPRGLVRSSRALWTLRIRHRDE